MKYILILFLCSLGSGFAQNCLVAHYRAVQAIQISTEGKPGRNIVMNYKYTFGFTKHYGISYAVNTDLQLHPSGAIVISDDGVNNQTLQVSTKPIQRLSWYHYDSLMLRSISDPVSAKDTCAGERYAFTYTKGAEPWIFLNETRVINQVTCQRAKLYDRKGEPIWDVWFAPDIPVKGIFFSLMDLPGLVLEGEHFFTRTKFNIESIEAVNEQDPRLQLPNCFYQQPFTNRGIIKPYNVPKSVNQ